MRPMLVGQIAFGPYTFTVYDDGSLAEGRTWYEDAATAARELGIHAEAARMLADAVGGCIESWRDAKLGSR
jgi:hypothetical protein